MSVETAEEVRKHVKVYIAVFAALAALTIVTVGLSYLHLPPFWGITFALIVATIKGTLVACYFMHLISERAIIFWILIVCFIFFAHLLLLPVATSSH